MLQVRLWKSVRMLSSPTKPEEQYEFKMLQHRQNGVSISETYKHIRWPDMTIIGVSMNCSALLNA